MAPTKELIDELFLDKVRQARSMSMEQRVLSGPQLFDYACSIARMGIRSQYPDADEETVERHLSRRLAIAEKLEQQQ